MEELPRTAAGTEPAQRTKAVHSVSGSGAAAPNFKVTFVGVYDDVEVRVGTILFDQNATEGLFEDANHGWAVNAFEIFELSKGIYQTDVFHFNLTSILLWIRGLDLFEKVYR